MVGRAALELGPLIDAATQDASILLNANELYCIFLCIYLCVVICFVLLVLFNFEFFMTTLVLSAIATVNFNGISVLGHNATIECTNGDAKIDAQYGKLFCFFYILFYLLHYRLFTSKF